MLPKIDNSETFARTFSPFSLAEIDDVLFGRSGRNIVKSYDRGRTTERWFSQNDSEMGNIRTLIAVNINKVIVGIESDNIEKEGYYLIEIQDDITNVRFLEVKGNEWMSIAFSQDRYPRNGSGDKIILMGEYGKHGFENFPRNLYVYQENIESFRKIYELPNFVMNKTHLHGVFYDWRSDVIWVCSGDERPSANLFYSKNWRDDNPTFQEVWEQGTAPIQFTSIYATDDLILLGSDGVGDDGLYALNRTVDNEYNSPELLSLFHLRDVELAKGFPLVGRTFHENNRGEIYVIFSSKTDFPSVVLGSINGTDWHVVFSTTEYGLAVAHLFDNILLMQFDSNGNNFKEITIKWESDEIPIPIVKDSKKVLEGYFVVNQNGVIKGVPMTNLSGVTQGTLVWGSPE